MTARSPRSFADSRGLQLALLVLATTSAYYARTTLGPLQETVRLALSFTDNQMALLQGPPLALGVVLGVPVGLLIDKVSRVRVLLVLAIVSAAASFLTSSASSFAELFALRCVTGLAASAIWATVLSLIADRYSPAQRGRATMVVAFGGLGGMSAAFALAGALLSIYHQNTGGQTAEGWRTAMLWLSVPLVVAILPPLFMREPPRTGVVEQSRSAWEVYAEIWRYRALVLPLTIGFVIVGIADGAAIIWAAPTFSRLFSLEQDRVAGIMAAILLISGVISPIVGGAVADLAQRAGGPHRTVGMLILLLVLSIPTGLFAMAPSVLCAGALLSAFLILGGGFNVAVQALVTIVMPNELRGSCLSLMLAISLVFAFGVAPVLVSQLSDAMGGLTMIGRALAIVCAISSAVGVVTLTAGRRNFPRE